MFEFKQQFDELTQNKYEYLKITRVSIYLKKQSATITAIFPQEREKEVFFDREKIEQAFTSVMNLKIPLKVELKRSHFDFDFFIEEFVEYLSNFPSLKYNLTADAITSSGNEITIRVSDQVYEYLKTTKAIKKINDFVASNFCEEIKVNYVLTGEMDTEITAKTEKSDFILDDNSSGRTIRVQNVEEYIGKIVYDLAGYIEDVTAPREYAVLCGRIIGINEIAYKRKGAPEDELLRTLYKFDLEDFTGRIHCVYFPTKKSRDKFLMLKEGKEVIMRGKLEVDRQDDRVINFIPHDISLCTLPTKFAINNIRRAVPEKYSVVFPQPYFSTEQSSLFDEAVEIPKFLIGKTFCVFDVETTGYHPDSDKIIEIGAVKIVDGVIKETFSSFVDPLEPIPERIVALTHIEDYMVKGKPLVEEVLLDFYKFCSDSILVGQNVQFDCGFITNKGRPYKMYFNNETMDTMILAQKIMPGLKNYKLGTIAKAVGIENESAHRAIYDAFTTARVFMELSKFL